MSIEHQESNLSVCPFTQLTPSVTLDLSWVWNKEFRHLQPTGAHSPAAEWLSGRCFPRRLRPVPMGQGEHEKVTSSEWRGQSSSGDGWG